ncbi:biotin/lipoyl-binding protein [Bacteriovoracaceae bacterium]|nr:biotin/lipoyl-binding protein [Bacteriovoracaceae bacterium]
MKRKKINFMCTAFRDGFQSAYGARVKTSDFLPAVEAARAAGITYFEAGGGARFQSLYFYCQENAFDMMDQFRAAAGPDAKLQTLARGVNVVGLESQSSEIIKLHAQLFKKHGIDVIRNFDALNDVNNLIYSGKVIQEAGLEHQVCVTLMELPPGCVGAHDKEFYELTLRQILDAEIPFKSLCFKDASGTAVPQKIFETIKSARKLLGRDVPIHFHTHDTAGVGVMGNKAALEAGADSIDLSLAPCSGGTCQPDVLVMWHALRGTEYDLDIDVDRVRESEEVFKECMKDYFLPPEATCVEPLIPWSPMPGGALTANTQMLRDNGIMDKYNDIIKAMSDVVSKGGFGTSVTPVSQFYFQQAFNNVMFGPWKKIAPSFGEMVLGYFGKTPVTPDEEVVKLAMDQLNLPINKKTVLELNDSKPEKGLDAARKILEAEKLPISDENIFIVATCKEKGLLYLHGKGENGIRKKIEESPTVGPYRIEVSGESFEVELTQENEVLVNGKAYKVSLNEGSKSQTKVGNQKSEKVQAHMPGKIFKLLVSVGDHVKEGDVVLILEAMKMEIEVKTSKSGKVEKIAFTVGQQVNTGDDLVYLTNN